MNIKKDIIMKISEEILAKAKEIIDTKPIGEDGVEIEGTPLTVVSKTKKGDLPVFRLSSVYIIVQRGI